MAMKSPCFHLSPAASGDTLQVAANIPFGAPKPAGKERGRATKGEVPDTVLIVVQ